MYVYIYGIYKRKLVWSYEGKFILLYRLLIYRNVNINCRLLMSSEELRLFDKIRVFLDEDYSSAEHFTVSCEVYVYGGVSSGLGKSGYKLFIK